MENKTGLKEKIAMFILGPVKNGIESILLFMAVSFATLAFTKLFFCLTVVPTGSMIPTIPIGTFQVASRISYMVHKPERGDIAIFYRDTDTIRKQLLTKRVIGIPGDKIAIQDGVLYLNGIKCEEPYLNSDAGEDFPEVVIPENQYLMLGDNRYSSYDGRYWDEHFVSEKNIIGKCVLLIGKGLGVKKTF